MEFILEDRRKRDRESSDIGVSQNFIEHFVNPDQIPNDTYYISKRARNFCVTFGLPWLYPYGVYVRMMVRHL